MAEDGDPLHGHEDPRVDGAGGPATSPPPDDGIDVPVAGLSASSMFDTLPWGCDGAENGGSPAVLLPFSPQGEANDAGEGAAWGDRGGLYGGLTAVAPSASPHA
eukprot:12357692-Alexandrium_andersonii.AAC.1